MISFSDFTWTWFPQQIVEMANIRPERTGLIAVIHVMSRGGAKHGPRVKVSNIAGSYSHSDNFTVTAEVKPRIIGNCKLKKQFLDDIVDWVLLNREHLEKVWNHGDVMDIDEVSAGFKKL